MQSGEIDVATRRHATHYLELFEDAEAEAGARPVDEWLAEPLGKRQLGPMQAAQGSIKRQAQSAVS